MSLKTTNFPFHMGCKLCVVRMECTTSIADDLLLPLAVVVPQAVLSRWGISLASDIVVAMLSASCGEYALGSRNLSAVRRTISLTHRRRSSSAVSCRRELDNNPSFAVSTMPFKYSMARSRPSAPRDMFANVTPPSFVFQPFSNSTPVSCNFSNNSR